MSTVIYTNAEIYFDGAKLAEAMTVKITRTSKAQQVDTMGRGFAGMSPGAKMLNISVENAIPSADFELNPGPFISGLRVVELTIFSAGRTLTSKGFVTDDSWSTGINSPSTLSFEFAGEFADWTA